MIVKIKKLHPDASVPAKAHCGDFCYDVKAVSCEEVAPNVYRYGLGFALQIDRRYVDEKVVSLSIDARPRSSIWKTGMSLANATATVDANFTGEISLVFYHLFPDMPKYEPGDRIAQIKIGTTIPIDFEEADMLEATDRGDGRFGSTGK